MTHSVPRRCLRDPIREQLLSRILEGTYAPGYRLIELDLAAEFGVSQSPIREALRELEAIGVVDSQRYRGTRVRTPNPQEMLEAYALRAILEQRAAELCVPLKKSVLGQLRRELEALLETAQDQKVARYTRHALNFHRLIVQHSGNGLFLDTWERLQTRAGLPFAALHLRHQLSRFARAHEPILAALEAQDGQQAGLLLRQFMEHTAAEIGLQTQTRNPMHPN